MKKVVRSWGYYRTLFALPWFKIKILCIFPENRTSVQKHLFRKELFIYLHNQHSKLHVDYVAANSWHRIYNDHKSKPQYLLELQWGALVSENDIQRQGEI